MSDASGKTRHVRCLACLGNAGDPATWSGTQYYFFQAARKAGFLDVALDLRPERMRGRRVLWNLLAPFRLERPGGYQYTDGFLSRLYEQVPAELRGAEVVSHFQLFPPLARARSDGAPFSFYIDATLRRLFEEYGIGRGVGTRTRRRALARERETYHAADRVVTMSRWARDSVVQEYDVPPEKVYTVLPGANLLDEVVEGLTEGLDERPIETDFRPERPFRLGFMGKDFRRKGLRRLVGAAEALAARGRPVQVSVVGHCPPDLKSHPLVVAHGFIDKSSQVERFAEVISDSDLGCLVSHAEALGISTLEYLRFGVPVLGTAVGGIPDCVPPEAGVLVAATCTPEELADAIEPLILAPDGYAERRRAARRIGGRFTWGRAVEEFRRIWRSVEEKAAGE